MLSTRTEHYSGHSYLIAAMQELKYKADPRGVCAGAIHMGIQAFFVDELDEYNARIVHIHKTWETIQCSKMLYKGGTLIKYAPYKKSVASLQTPDCLAFFDGIELYQNPSQYPEIFGHYLSQFKPELISLTTSSKKLAAQGGLAQVDHYLAYFTKEDLADFFKWIGLYAGNNKIAMSLDFEFHRSSVCYDGRLKKWLLVDSNQLPVHRVLINHLAERVFSAHTFDEENFDSAPISIRLYATKNNLVNVQQSTEALKLNNTFQSLLEITSEDAQLRSKYHCNLLHHAARYNHADSIVYMLNSLKLDPNTMASENYTPLHIAAYHGHFLSAKALLKNKKTHVDLQDESGMSALYIAAQNGHKDIVSLLLRYQADPQLSCHYLTHPVTIAAIMGHLDVLQKFSESGVDLFQPDDRGKTAMYYAVQQGHQPIIQYLKEILKQQRVKQIAESGSLRKHSLFSPSFYQEEKPSLPDERVTKKIRLIIRSTH